MPGHSPCGGSELSLSQGWNIISDGGLTRPVVLAVDFDTTGRKEATFHDLVQSFPGPRTVWLSAQPPDSHRAELSPSEYLTWWAGDSLGVSTQVGAVMGYCAGSYFAAALADAMEQRQGFRPKVVLFNPGRPDVTTLRTDFAGTIDSMSLLTPDERSGFLEKGRTALDASSASFDEACETVLGLYGQASRVTFSRAGIDADVGDELLGVFRSYTSYLRAARQVEYRPEWAESAAVVSKEHSSKPAFTRTRIRSEAGRENLLGEPEVARTAFRLVEAEG